MSDVRTTDGLSDSRPTVILPAVSATDRARIEAAVGSRAAVVTDSEIADVGTLTGELVLVTGMAHERMLRLAAAPGMRWVHCSSSGVEHLPLEDLARRGVLLTNSAGAHAPAMAEYAVGSMIALAHGFRTWTDGQRDRRWLPLDTTPVSLLLGKRLGIVGYGAVGRRLAIVAAALGMRTWALRRSPLFPAGEPIERVMGPDALRELLAGSDFVVLSASLNSSSRFLIGEAELGVIKPGAFLVNVARGGLVDEEALVRALRSGRLGGAALDATGTEPLPPDSPLWDAPNLLITPHVSGASPESWEAVIDFLCQNLRAYLAGTPQRLGNLVRYDSVL